MGDLMDRPVGTKHDEDNCYSFDIYKVECTSTLDIADFDCSYVPVAEEDCNDDWNCYWDYDEEEGYPLNDCGAITVCPMVIDDMSLDGMFCEADKNTDGVAPEGTSADLNNCGKFDVYQVVCVAKEMEEETCTVTATAECDFCKCDQVSDKTAATSVATLEDCVELIGDTYDTFSYWEDGRLCEGHDSLCTQKTTGSSFHWKIYNTECITDVDEPAVDVCAGYDKKPCRKEHSDECKWNSVLKSCVSNDWTPVCSEYTSNKKSCKRFIKEGYACEWSAKECKATDAVCVPGWIEVELLKNKDTKTKHKYIDSIEACVAKGTEVGAQGVIYEPSHKHQICLTFATVGDYHPGTSADSDLVIYYNEAC